MHIYIYDGIGPFFLWLSLAGGGRQGGGSSCCENVNVMRNARGNSH